MAHATRWLGTCCLALAALAACSGDDDALPSEPPVEPRETTTTSAAVTSAPPPTSAVSTTQSRPVSSATAPSTTLAQPTSPPTTASVDPDVQAALATVEQFYELWRDCLRDLPNCDPASFSRVAVGTAAASFESQIRDWQADSRTAEAVETYTAAAISTARDQGRIVVPVCERDGIVLLRAQPGGEPVVVSDESISKIREWDVDPTPEGWRIVGVRTLEELVGMEGDLCA